MLGIELNEYAAELARVTVWIGKLQWRLLHDFEFKTNPVLEPLDHIECRDALLAFLPDSGAKLPPPLGEGGGEGSPIPVEASWPKANGGAGPSRAFGVKCASSPTSTGASSYKKNSSTNARRAHCPRRQAPQ